MNEEINVIELATPLETPPISAVLAAIEDEFGSYSVEELRTLGGAALAREVVRAGISADDADNVDAAEWADRISAAVAKTPPVVERPELVRSIVETAFAFGSVAVTGAAGSGKTMVLQRLLQRDPAARARFSRIIRIDCAALRMADPVQLSKNAVWAIFGVEEEAYRRFIYECRRRGDVDPLLALLAHRLAGGGLFIMDHMEHLNRSDGIDNWLCDSLLPLSRKIGFSVAFCDRSMASLMKFTKFGRTRLAEVRVDNFSGPELADWLRAPFFATIQGCSIGAADVLGVTGGSPRLVRDLANFILLDRYADAKTIDKFRRSRPKEYVAHCERLIWAKRTLPALLFDDLRELAVARLSVDERQRISEILCSTGVVRQTDDGGFDYVSPIHSDRAAFLTKREVLSLALLRATSLEALDSKSQEVRLRDCAEIAVDPLSQFLAGERSARLALQKLRSILHNWGFRATLFLRDRNNARLFLALLQGGDRIFPLDDGEFIRAVQTGRSVVTGEESENPGELLVPVIGYTGTVEMIFRGRFCTKSAPRYMRDIRRDRFVNLLRGLKPTLSQILDRFWACRDRQLDERLMYATKKSPVRSTVWQNVLEALSSNQPAALAVLHRPQKRWRVASFDRVGRADGKDCLVFADDSWAEPADSGRLDAIAVHPSQHGLVLSHSDAIRIFPLLAAEKDAAVYVRPVPFNKDFRLVVFMFKRAPAGGLDGNVQQRLWVAAPAIAAAS